MLDDSAEALELAKQNVRKRKFKAAIEILTPAVEANPRNADLFNCLATANYLAGDLDEALKAFQQVTKIKPTLAAAWVNIGAVYNRQGKYHEAVRALRKGTQRDKRAAQGYYNLGIAQKGLNRLAMAATAYKDAIKVDPKMAEAHQNLGNVYLDMGNSRQAITSFKKALELRPNFARAKKGLAIAENAAGEQIQKDNPFGRLVSKEDLADQKTTLSKTFRELTDEERYEDRQYIRGRTGTVRENTRELITFLRDKLEPSILQLGRVVCGADTGKDLAGLFDEFQQNCVTAKALQAEIHREMAELKKHDAEIRS
jgi:tetratricopeptide (TPR) repeat protein